jgi:hypothetical protein
MLNHFNIREAMMMLVPALALLLLACGVCLPFLIRPEKEERYRF